MKPFFPILPIAFFTTTLSYPPRTTASEHSIGKLLLSDESNCQGEGATHFLIPQSAGCVNITRPFRSYEPTFGEACWVGEFSIYRLPDCQGSIAVNSTFDPRDIVAGLFCWNLDEGGASDVIDGEWQRLENSIRWENYQKYGVWWTEREEEEKQRIEKEREKYRIENGSAVFTCLIDESPGDRAFEDIS